MAVGPRWYQVTWPAGLLPTKQSGCWAPSNSSEWIMESPQVVPENPGAMLKVCLEKLINQPTQPNQKGEWTDNIKLQLSSCNCCTHVSSSETLG